MTALCSTLLYTAPEVLRVATSFNHCQSSSLSIPSVSSSSSSLSSTSTTVALVPSTLTSASPITYGYDESCDLWSLGVVLYTMLSGEVPFNLITTHRTAENIVEDITRLKLSYDIPAWKNVLLAAKDLVKDFLTVDPSKRLRIKDLSRNAWLRGSCIQTSHDFLMTPSILSRASRSLVVRAVNVTMRAFQKAGQFQLSSVTHGLLARRRYTKKSTDSCLSTSSSTTNNERLSQLINQHPLTTTTSPKRYGTTLTSRATVAINDVQHEFAFPASPAPLFLVPSLSSSSSFSFTTNIHS